MRVCVLAADDMFDTGLASLVDTLDTANELAATLGPAKAFEVTLVGVRARVRTHLGLVVPVVAPPRRIPQLVIVPALACKQPAGLEAALDRPDVREACELIADWASRGCRVAAACTGTFVLGRAGTLDGKRATTSWWLGPAFRRLFPAVDLEESEMVVRDGAVLTAGAALAHVDLALAVVRERSPELAALVARYLLVDDRPSQAPFMAPAQLAYDDELVRKFERWVRNHLREPFVLARAAKAIGASERTLQRRVRTVLGRPPIAFVQDLRLERAVHLLRVTRTPIEDIATAVGYADGSTLRTLMRRRLRTTVHELRS